MLIRNFRRSFALTVIISVAIFSALPDSAIARTEQTALIEQYIQTATDVVTAWRWAARVVLTLAIAVGVFGLITASLQPLKHAAAKITAAVIGVLISIATLVTKHCFRERSSRLLWPRCRG